MNSVFLLLLFISCSFSQVTQLDVEYSLHNYVLDLNDLFKMGQNEYCNGTHENVGLIYWTTQSLVNKYFSPDISSFIVENERSGVALVNFTIGATTYGPYGPYVLANSSMVLDAIINYLFYVTTEFTSPPTAFTPSSEVITISKGVSADVEANQQILSFYCSLNPQSQTIERSLTLVQSRYILNFFFNMGDWQIKKFIEKQQPYIIYTSAKQY
jgi:hypothetical protein